MPIALPPATTTSLLDAISAIVPAQQRLWRFSREYVLGTRLEILAHTPSRATADVAARAARAEIERLNAVLNDRHPDSELSKLVRVRRSIVSADLFAVLQLSETWRCISGGAFDGRLGALLRLWATDTEPRQRHIQSTLGAAQTSSIKLDPATRWVELSPAVAPALDAVAKGYIVDAALGAARHAAPTLQGIAINIGGDIRCWGQSPMPCGWRVGIPHPAITADNAPLVDAVALRNTAIATSGLGPRDRIRDSYRSTTISPFTGCPVRDVISATVVASHAADADAIATACMVLAPAEGLALVDRLEGAAARITGADGEVHVSDRWPTLRLAGATTQSPSGSAEGAGPTVPPELRWPPDWELRVNYTATEQQYEPYVVVWITNSENKLITTLFALGKDPKWARENFIWWNSIGEGAQHEIELRSRSTTRSGQYEISWIGVDENIQPLPIGKYVLNFETSQEHGKHTYRAVPIQIGHERFKLSVGDLNGMGDLELAYGAYNDRFNPLPFLNAPPR